MLRLTKTLNNPQCDASRFFHFEKSRPTLVKVENIFPGSTNNLTAFSAWTFCKNIITVQHRNNHTAWKNCQTTAFHKRVERVEIAATLYQLCGGSRHATIAKQTIFKKLQNLGYSAKKESMRYK